MTLIRQAQASDVAAMHRVRLAVLENRLVSLKLTEADTIRAIQSTGRGWVADVEAEVVGFAVGDGDSGHIWALFVHPDHEGRGHDRRLHEAMVGWLWSRGLERLSLTTDPGTRAQEFYKSAGWRVVGQTDGGELRCELARPGHVMFSPRPLRDTPSGGSGQV